MIVYARLINGAGKKKDCDICGKKLKKGCWLIKSRPDGQITGRTKSIHVCRHHYDPELKQLDQKKAA